MKTFRHALLGIGAIAAMTAAAHASDLTLCTGGEGGPYNQIGGAIASTLRQSGLDVKVVVTNGTWDNIERSTGIAGKQPTQADYDSGTACQAFIGQPDGYSALKRKNPGEAKKLVEVGKLHTEYLHVLCNKESGYDDLGQLAGRTDVTLSIGAPGSGASLIWENFIAEDDSYANVPTNTDSGDDAVLNVANGTTTCMLVPAGVPNKVVLDADELFGEQLVLAGANDKDFNDAVDSLGKPLYAYSEIPSGTYDKHLQGWFSAKDTVTWKAAAFVNTERLTDKNVKGKLIRAIAQIRPWAAKEFGGGN